ncbi:MAG: MFS transporter [Bdellovibrionaceae bacterium]|nr:MFS transporter [Pseudobdellovibrionaceae bacterium]
MAEKSVTNKSSFSQFLSAINLTVLVAGLGYFVDMFDITLFGVVRVASLKDLGVTDPQEILKSGVLLYNAQMIGMMLGGLLWGVWADKRGRLSVMFGSIILYSLGNIANAFVWDVNSYAICRFITGIGLAGELGAAITLVAESLPKETRGYGTTIVATLGLLGSVTAAYFGQHIYWKSAYIMGGVMGLLLLVTRFRVFESGMYEKTHEKNVERGNLGMLLKKGRLLKYLKCIFMGIPIYFITGVLFTFSPELTQSLDVQGSVSAGGALLWGSIGLAVGDFLSGMLSQLLKSRNKAISICLAVAFCLILCYLNFRGLTPDGIYFICFLLGSAAGYWAVLVTVSAEQFGTNIRGTVATTVPNFVRGAAALVVSLFLYLKTELGAADTAALVVGVIFFALALLSIWTLEETYGKELDYFER